MCHREKQKGAKGAYLAILHRLMHTLNATSFPEGNVGASVSGCLPRTLGYHRRSHILSRVNIILAT